MKMKRGTKVLFTADNLGVFDLESVSRMHASITVNSGDEGKYVERSPHTNMEDWHHISIERTGRVYIVPAHESMFEKAR